MSEENRDNITSKILKLREKNPKADQIVFDVLGNLCTLEMHNEEREAKGFLKATFKDKQSALQFVDNLFGKDKYKSIDAKIIVGKVEENVNDDVTLPYTNFSLSMEFINEEPLPEVQSLTTSKDDETKSHQKRTIRIYKMENVTLDHFQYCVSIHIPNHKLSAIIEACSASLFYVSYDEEGLVLSKENNNE